MRLATIVVIGGAVVAGIIAAMGARAVLLSASRPMVADAPHSTIVVAKAPLSFGAPISKESIQEEPWYSSTLPEGAFGKVDDVLKDGQRVVLSPIGKSEPILASRISGPGQKAFLSTVIEPGRSAVTIRVDDVRGVAGFIMPGDRVDVTLTRSEGTSTFTDVLLQRVKVLAIDQVATQPDQNHATVAKAVTLEVTTEQGQKLILASGAGSLALILRRASDSDSELPRRVSINDLARGEAADEPVAKKEEPEPPPFVNVRIIRGVSSQVTSVQRQDR